MIQNHREQYLNQLTLLTRDKHNSAFQVEATKTINIAEFQQNQT